MKKFRFCDYWGTWNRMLAVDNLWYFELDLTPINAGSIKSWDKTCQEVIRVHCTAIKPNEWHDTLPEKIRAVMALRYGDELTEKLLNHDYLAEVTLADMLNASKHSNGGGTPLFAIKEIRDGQRSHWQWKD